MVVDSRGVIRLVNRQTEALFGYERDEMLGRPVELLGPTRIATRHQELRSSYFASPRTRPMGAGLELTARRKDGTEFPVDISLSPLETEEGTLVSAAVRDITERKRAEKERELAKVQQSQRLESLGQLAGGVAHDFNNLLAAILNYSGLIVEDPGNAASVEHDVREIIRAAERGAALTRQLLMFGRRELLRPEVLDLNSIVADLEKMLRRTIGEHIDMRTNLTASLWRVKADPSAIEQVLMNLVVNARDAMLSGGALTIATANLAIESDFEAEPWNLSRGRYARLTVADTGVGMPPDVVVRAFEPFFSTKPKGSGTGLGLATVYGIVTQAGGDVHIYSEPGIGTAVRVYLPVTEEVAAVPRPHVPAGGTEAQGETILVVEDEDQVRDPTIRVLSRQGYNVISARNGKEALEVIAGHKGRIDLVFTDVIMPQMSGAELADHVRVSHPDTPILFTSGYPQDLERGAGAGTVTLLEKPYTVEQLLRRVRSVIEQKKPARAPSEMDPA